MKIEIKNKNGKLIFTYNCRNNTIKKTVEYANFKGVNLSNAKLNNANLKYASLKGINLNGADLKDTNLKGADLRDSDLRNSDLRGSNLINIDLKDSNLENSNLLNSNLNYANLKGANLKDANLSIFCKYNVSFKNNYIYIGCKKKTIKEWDEFFKSNKEFNIKKDTMDFKRIEAMYEATKTYIKILNK